MNTSISFQNIDSIPQMIKDFLNQTLEGMELYTFNLKNIENHIVAKQKTFALEQRQVLCQVLERQMKGVNVSELQNENLIKLAKENTFTITTGHQLNLFTGPVFFIYKILQTIKTAVFLKEKFPQYHFVPIFWMATEDHDFEEIHHFKTPNRYYEMRGQAGGAVGRIPVEEQAFIAQFEEAFQDTIYGTELLRWMKDAYQKGKTLAEATRLLVNYLFSEYGLLILDGDDRDLKQRMIPIFKEELLHQSLFKTTQPQIEILQNRYGKVQVNPRDINLFYLSETRNRIEYDAGRYKTVEASFQWTEEALVQELEAYPERFSPNALMRPVYQEWVLPNLAYIGGNAEIMYWIELKDYFKYLNLAFPILIPRNSMLFLNEKTFRKMEKLGLSVEDFFRNFAKVIEERLLSNSDISPLLADKEQELKQIFTEIQTASEQTDVTFRNLVKAEEVRQLKAFQRMKKRLLRAEKRKHQEEIERIEHLFNEIYPNKNWQERVYNFSTFYADYGKSWLQSCYNAIDVEKSELNIQKL
ncbi:bacillithiol biosynthesis cysteine-adding enzyme BshC [Bergeyella porcorum]|uniref:bacillithiol biosynthesis cysteine-adding enzyme BshC n=1 Tax=Bergeyella porcorum TaxID=1735111 RepID=UPI0035E7F2A3